MTEDDVEQNLAVALQAAALALWRLRLPRGLFGLWYTRKQVMAAKDDIDAVTAELVAALPKVQALVAASGASEDATLAPSIVALGQAASAITAALPTS